MLITEPAAAMRLRGLLIAVGKGRRRGRQGYMTAAALVIPNNRILFTSFVGNRPIVASNKKPHLSYHLLPVLLLLPQSRGYNYRGVMSSSSPPSVSVSSRKKVEEEMQKKGVEDEEEEEEKPVPESTIPLPPPPSPPEKPLPGDCCGSGCVRCVWDVYYEELEAYNELLSTTQSEIKKSS